MKCRCPEASAPTPSQVLLCCADAGHAAGGVCRHRGHRQHHHIRALLQLRRRLRPAPPGAWITHATRLRWSPAVSVSARVPASASGADGRSARRLQQQCDPSRPAGLPGSSSIAFLTPQGAVDPRALASAAAVPEPPRKRLTPSGSVARCICRRARRTSRGAGSGDVICPTLPWECVTHSES